MNNRKRITREEREAQIRRRLLLFAAALLGVILLIIGILFLTKGRGKAEKADTAPLAGGQGAAPAVQLAGEDAEEMTEAVETEIITEAPDPYSDKPDIDPESWEFILANPDHSIEEYAPVTAQLEEIELDERIIDAMSAFVADTRAQGLNVVLTSGYRSYQTQSWLFQNKVAQYGGDEETAATIVARPGTSEHQTGLAA
ncbi:MAG: D-alanyl-D-alanine carboxypeptidase family protein, partial [Lachnospiraceae bacterium]|nr:D-alanyl-D-alanine carboxypeptidase family protein [Lachnospiraceae bacterium]